ncbi:hypothetical protein DERF_005691 [Dermatophagoides farinae]|uniref:SprT-like domain-containing protein n=2 Tax=Dermatophagoides farinae TaxID=6954 RepID=A0A922I8R8_DERFA|nr:uncharacterized protein LOC124490028 [Dermatophagoides farinae]KAH9522089.1 hypothetical protein DERF_005691 [Dermatophagoides farinae]
MMSNSSEFSVIVGNSFEFESDYNDNGDIEILFECHRPSATKSMITSSSTANSNRSNESKNNTRKRLCNRDDNDDEILLLQEFIPPASKIRRSDDVIFIESISSNKSLDRTNKEAQSRIVDYFRSSNYGKTICRSENQTDVMNKNKSLIENLSLMDPRLETLDPTPDIQCLFREFDSKFFESKLSNQKNFQIIWCNRLTASAGLFTVGYFRNGNEHGWRTEIRLSSKLLSLRPRSDLVNTLLHEMIHAYIYFAKIRDNGSHGQYFHEFMWKINQTAHTNITVFHNFHDEVKYAQNNLVVQRTQKNRKIIIKRPMKINQY